MKRQDLTGQKYNKLTVLGLNRSENGQVYWDCVCDCGNHAVVKSSNLKSGAVKSCGCLKHNVAHNRTHNESKTSLYRHWVSMIYRCTKPNHFAYKWYGARGIKVCDEWLTYEGFKEWVQATRPNETYTVDRIDVNGDYCPKNCRWIPMGEQANNRRTNVIIEYDGEKKSLMSWCEELGLNYKRVHNRMFKLGWDFERAISCPVDESKKNKKWK